MNGRKNHLALWAALTALFGNLAAINVLAVLGDDDDPYWQAVAALVTAVLVACAIYTKQRWDDAKAERETKPGRRK